MKMNYPSSVNDKTKNNQCQQSLNLKETRKAVTEIRSATLFAALGILGGVMAAAEPCFADEKNEKKNHGSQEFGLKGGFVITPDHYRPSYGFDAHFTWAPATKDSDVPHFEWTIIDVGVSIFKIPIHVPQLMNAKKDIQGTEFHLGSLATLAIPLGKVAELGVGGGFGIGFTTHPHATVGHDKNYLYYDVNAYTQTFPLVILEAELSFHVQDQFLLFAAYSPHFTLIKITEEIPPEKKHTKIDHSIIAGVGVDF